MRDPEIADLRERIDACLRGDGTAPAGKIGRAYLDLAAAGKVRFLRTLAEASAVLAAPRAQALKRFGLAPNGIRLVLDMRADLLREGEPGMVLAGLDRDLREVLKSLFAAGSLELRRDMPAD